MQKQIQPFGEYLMRIGNGIEKKFDKGKIETPHSLIILLDP